MTNPILIVEIPWQRKPLAWLADSWSDAADRSGCESVDAEAVKAHIRADLSEGYFLQSEEEVLTFLETYDGLCVADACAAVLKQSRLLGWIGEGQESEDE